MVLAAMTPGELVEILLAVEGDALAGGGVLDDHFREGQSSWRKNSPRWARQKGFSVALREEGTLREAVRTPGHPNRGRKLTAGKGRLSIWLTKDQDNRNIYDMVQRGSLAALSFTGMDGAKRVIGAAEVIAERKRLSEEYRAWAVGAGATLQKDRKKPGGTKVHWGKGHGKGMGFDGWMKQQPSVLNRRAGEGKAERVTGGLPARHLMDMRPEDGRRLQDALERAVGAWLGNRGG